MFDAQYFTTYKCEQSSVLGFNSIGCYPTKCTMAAIVKRVDIAATVTGSMMELATQPVTNHMTPMLHHEIVLQEISQFVFGHLHPILGGHYTGPVRVAPRNIPENLKVPDSLLTEQF